MRYSSVLAGIFLTVLLVSGAFAEDTAGSGKQGIGRGPAVQESLPSSASPATTAKHTGATDQSGTVKSMNKQAKDRVETEGK